MSPSLTGGFYGWRIVAASFAILFISVGIALYASPVFLIPLQEHFGWSRAAIAAGSAIAALASGLLSPFVGGWIDRYGARRVMTLGALLMGSAFAGMSGVGALWQLYALNLLGAFGLTCVAWIPNQTLVSNWFERKRGLAMGVTLSGIGFGGLAMAPLAAILIDAVGWRLAFAGLSSLIFSIVVALTLTVVRSRPADLSLLPDGDPLDPARAGPLATAGAGLQPPGLELSQSFQTRCFWILAVCNLLSVFGGLSIIGHLHAFLTDAGFDSQLAAASLGLAIGASVAGRLLFGWLADRFSKKGVMTLSLLLQALATVFLLRIQAAGALHAFVVSFGLALGGVAVLLPLLVGDCFGLRCFGKILGVIMIAATLGAAIGQVLTGWIFDVTGSYRLAFALHLGAFLTAALSMCFLGRPPHTASARP